MSGDHVCKHGRHPNACRQCRSGSRQHKDFSRKRKFRTVNISKDKVYKGVTFDKSRCY